MLCLQPQIVRERERQKEIDREREKIAGDLYKNICESRGRNKSAVVKYYYRRLQTQQDKTAALNRYFLFFLIDTHGKKIVFEKEYSRF